MSTTINADDLKSKLTRAHDLLDMYNVTQAMDIIQSLIAQIDSFQLKSSNLALLNNSQLSMKDIDASREYRIANINPDSSYYNKVVKIINKRRKYILVSLTLHNKLTSVLVAPHQLEEI
jgi:hypothetical protein